MIDTLITAGVGAMAAITVMAFVSARGELKSYAPVQRASIGVLSGFGTIAFGALHAGWDKLAIGAFGALFGLPIAAYAITDTLAENAEENGAIARVVMAVIPADDDGE